MEKFACDFKNSWKFPQSSHVTKSFTEHRANNVLRKISNANGIYGLVEKQLFLKPGLSTKQKFQFAAVFRYSEKAIFLE